MFQRNGPNLHMLLILLQVTLEQGRIGVPTPLVVEDLHITVDSQSNYSWLPSSIFGPRRGVCSWEYKNAGADLQLGLNTRM